MCYVEVMFSQIVSINSHRFAFNRKNSDLEQNSFLINPNYSTLFLLISLFNKRKNNLRVL